MVKRWSDRWLVGCAAHGPAAMPVPTAAPAPSGALGTQKATCCDVITAVGGRPPRRGQQVRGLTARPRVLPSQVALQDHLLRQLASRSIVLPGAPRAAPTLVPGAPQTLAQLRNLVPSAPALLTTQQWAAVRSQYQARRQTSAPTCAVCCELLSRCCSDPGAVCGRGTTPGGSGSGSNGAAAVALLSCSHAFHAACLRACECAAAARSLPRTCPLCRAAYQCAAMADADAAWRERCATTIAAAVRGWLARRRYLEMLSATPAPAHPLADLGTQ